MTRDLVVVGEETELDELIEQLEARGLSGVPVVDRAGDLVGVVSKTDVVRALAPATRAASIPSCVAEIMTRFAFTLPVDAGLARAAALMVYEGIHRVLVVDPAGALVGVVSISDVARHFALASGFSLLARHDRPAAVVVAPPVDARRILIIEDDAEIRREVSDLLRDHGYDTATAADSAEALERLASMDPPDLILLDLMLPVVDGWGLHAELRHHPELSGIPVVLLSGVRDLPRHARALGASDYLVKPFRPEAVLEVARKYTS